MVKHGFGRCELVQERSRYTSMLFQRECGKFQQADDKTIDARRAEWAKIKKG